MQHCSVCSRLRIVPGGSEDYRQLARYHYRDHRSGPRAAIFALKSDGTLPGVLSRTAVGVIVYSTARPAQEMRNIATDGVFAGLDRDTQLALIGRNIRRLSRVIIEPRFRGLGLAVRLVRETMPLLNVPIIEASAVMGLVNPFLEKAGMKAYEARPSVAAVQLIEAFSLFGIEDSELIAPQHVHKKLERLSGAQRGFLERYIGNFLKSHGRRREMPPGLERTRYIVTRLTAQPTYYIWFNPELNLEKITGLRKESVSCPSSHPLKKRRRFAHAKDEE